MKQKIEPEKILADYSSDNRYMLDVLHHFQDTYHCISMDHIKVIAEHFGVSASAVFSELTFYDAFSTEEKARIEIQVCDGTVCHAKGSKKLLKQIEKEMGIRPGEKTKNGKVSLKTVRCMGFCEQAPVVSCNDALFTKMTEDKLGEVVDYRRNTGIARSDVDINLLESGYETILLKKAATINEYEQTGGFEGMKNAFAMQRRKAIWEEVKTSGLRGRSGSGFLVGDKWKSAYDAQGRSSNMTDKYIIANGDEGDPGAFMDRWIMENNPYMVIEGMIIAGRCIGATKGFIYIRDEYEAAIEKMKGALDEVRKKKYLSKKILGSDYTFDIEVVRAGRSYLCGEESALIESIEGKSGIPRLKPPYPTFRGLKQQPTLVNNIETFANIPIILKIGGEEFRKIGTEDCTGTKLLSLAGSIANKGLVEIPMGKISLRDLIFEIGGGMEPGKTFKCVHLGGPTGKFLSETDLDIMLDFNAFREKGFMLGSGGVIVIDQETSALDLLKYSLEFYADETCGTCTPCREGLRVLGEIVSRFEKRGGTRTDYETIKDILFMAKISSRCAFGKSIENPVSSLIDSFKEEFDGYIKEEKR